MGLMECLALSAAANVMLAFALLKTRQKLRGAVHALTEVGAGRAEVVDLGDKIAVRHKIIKRENNVTL